MGVAAALTPARASVLRTALMCYTSRNAVSAQPLVNDHDALARH
jgi:hypothetical protein